MTLTHSLGPFKCNFLHFTAFRPDAPRLFTPFISQLTLIYLTNLPLIPSLNPGAHTWIAFLFQFVLLDCLLSQVLPALNSFLDTLLTCELVDGTVNFQLNFPSIQPALFLGRPCVLVPLTVKIQSFQYLC